jgi:ferritin-like metal-binding protein YciE
MRLKGKPALGGTSRCFGQQAGNTQKGKGNPEVAETDINVRDAKLIQYLNEAFGKEKQLETALEAHIAMTNRDNYKKRLQDHLRETKAHARDVERRIKQLGGEAEAVSIPGPEVVSEAAARVQEVAQRGVALAQGPLHAMRGTGEQEKLLKNAKSEYSDEAEEIATYTAIETLADNVGDRETARLARGIRRQEERMASFLERLIPQLTKAVVQAEIPPAFRNGGRRRRASSSRSAGSRRTARASSARGGAGTRRASASGRGGGSGRAAGGRKATAAGRTKTTRGTAPARRTASSRRTGSTRSGGARRTAARSSAGSTTARSGRGTARKRATRSR